MAGRRLPWVTGRRVANSGRVTRPDLPFPPRPLTPLSVFLFHSGVTDEFPFPELVSVPGGREPRVTQGTPPSRRARRPVREPPCRLPWPREDKNICKLEITREVPSASVSEARRDRGTETGGTVLVTQPRGDTGGEVSPRGGKAGTSPPPPASPCPPSRPSPLSPGPPRAGSPRSLVISGPFNCRGLHP